MPEIPPSFDSEGLFPLDGMEEKDILDEDEHSEDDLSDTDGKLFYITWSVYGKYWRNEYIKNFNRCAN